MREASQIFKAVSIEMYVRRYFANWGETRAWKQEDRDGVGDKVLLGGGRSWEVT